MNYSYNIHKQQRSVLKNFLNSSKHACLVSGPAGVGKTILTRTVIKDEDFRTLYLKFGQFDRTGCLSTEVIQLLDLPTREEAESTSTYGLQEADAFCANALKEFDRGQTKPCILVIDDVQWMSYRDLGALDKVFSFPEYSQLKIIFIFRVEEKCESFQSQLTYKLNTCFHDLSVVDLKPLSTTESLTMLNTSEFLSVNSFETQEIIQASNGLPALLRFFTSIKGSQFSSEIAQFMRINLGDELCYIAFVCAQFGYIFSESLISHFFIDSKQQASNRIQELMNFGILQYYDKNNESLQFSHDIIFRESRSLYNEERLCNVNFKLFNVFKGSPAKNNNEIESIKKAIALIRSGQNNRNSIPPEFEVDIYLKALECSVSKHFVEQGFFIAKFIDSEIPFENIDERTRFRLCQNMTLIGHYQNDIEFCIHITDKTALFSKDPFIIAQVHSNLGNILFSRVVLHDAAERFEKALASIGINQQFKAGKLSIVEAGLAFLKIHRDFMKLQNFEESEKTCLDNKIIVENKILCIAASATISVDTFFGAKAISKVLKNTISHGFTSESAYALMLYAVGSVSHLRDYKKAVLYAEYGFFKLSQHTNSYYLSRAVFLYHCFIGVHRNTIQGNASAIHETIFSNLRESSIDFAAYAAHVASFHRLDSDSPLNEVCFWLDNYKKLLAPYEQNNTAMWMSVLSQTIADLQSKKRPNALMEGNHFSITGHISSPLKNNVDRSLVFIAYHYRSVLHVLFKDWRSAVADCNVASKYQIGVIGTYGEHLHKFIEGIAHARLSISDNKTGAAKLKLRGSIKFLKIPLSIGSIVVQSKLSLLQGYYSLLQRKVDDAKGYFQEAIILAKKNGHILDLILGLDAMILVSNIEDQAVFQITLTSTINEWGGSALLASYG